jgi:LuxR family maltose regulon positive regulatory protein
VSQPAETAGLQALLATKLHVPRPLPGFVARPRLTARLDAGLGGRLILVCAPAGFGKTSLLAAWASGGKRPVGWLSLDSSDNDPARFWRHVAASMERIRPGISDRVGPLLGPPAPQSFEAAVTALVNELAESGGGLLVLDDYHLVESQQVHADVAFALEHLPPGLCMVIATRADPPLRLGRLRTHSDITELRAADLRFTSQEAAALLRDTPGAAASDLTGAAIETLTARTEGWAAGLQLAALSLQGQADTDSFVAAFGGSHRYVLDYLAEEVLDNQDAPVRDFLLETSVLDRLSGELCDAVTGRPGGQAMLERIEQAGLFLVPLDEVRSWWRYHQLFRDLLRIRLNTERPGAAAALHRAAAAWHADKGLADEAIGHAVAAGDTEWAAELIETYFDGAYFTGENGTLERWLTAVPEGITHSRTRLSLVRAFIALTAGDVTAARQSLAAIRTEAPGRFRPSAGEEASLIANVPAATAIARAWLAYLRGDPEQMTRFAAQARTELREGEWMLKSIYQLNLALADWLSGRLAAAEPTFISAIDWWRETSQGSLAAQGWNFVGQIRRFRGSLDGALDAYGELLKITEVSPGAPSPVSGIGHVGSAEVHYQRGDLAAARQELAIGLPRCRQLSDTQALATGLATLAWIEHAEADPARARQVIAEAEQAGPSSAVADLLNPVPALRARLLLAQGDVDAAERWAVARGISPDDDPPYVRERDYLVLARVLLAQDRCAQALGLLDRLLVTAQAQGRLGSVIEIRALRALAASAAEELARALTMASGQGFIRVFADEGSPMAALLGLVLAGHREGEEPFSKVPLGYLARVIRACEPLGTGQPRTSMIDPLTPRETQVLELIAVGAPNQRIAEELVVTLDTVKKHVTHVLAKLGAVNRTEAVARARELGTIP